MFDKAYRWAAEMNEIGTVLGQSGSHDLSRSGPTLWGDRRWPRCPCSGWADCHAAILLSL